MQAVEPEKIVDVPSATEAVVERANILLVDDEKRNLDALEIILTAPDLRLIRAQGAEEALLALMNNEFACIVLDIQMPTMSGLDLARLIKTRKRNQHIPIIFLTAYFLEERDILQGYGVGAVDYLTKPVNPQILRSKVGVFVTLFRTARALSAANASLESEIAQRKKAEEALRQTNNELETRVQQRVEELKFAEKRYRQVVRNLPAAVYVTDVEGRVTLFNEAAVALWGREPELGKDLWCGSSKSFNPDGSELPLNESPMAVTLKTGVAVRGQEIIIERPDGTRRNVLPHPEPLHDAAGNIIGAINMVMDITERKRSEAAAQRLAAIVQTSDDAILSKNLNSIITSWNESAERLFGYSAGEVIGKPITLLIPPGRQDEETQILNSIRKGEPVHQFETIRLRKDGSLVEVSLTISPIKDNEGKIIGGSQIAHDITQRKRGEKQQRALYELVVAVNRASSLREVCDAALDAIFQCQASDRAAILLCDSAGVMRFTAWRGISEDYRRAVEGHSPWKKDEMPGPVLISNVDAAPFDEELRSIVKGEGIRALAFIPILYNDRLLGKFMVYFNTTHEFASGELQPAQTIASQIASAIERQRVLLELKKAHDEALGASRAKDEFLATLSHELRTPLNPILLVASDAATNLKLPDPVRADFEMVRKNVELEARLIDDLLDLTRVTRGKVLLEKQIMDVHAVLKDAIANVQEEMKQKGIIPTIKLGAMSHAVYADGVRLQQVFWNLLKNAVKFTPPGGHITVETELPDEDHLLVKITDTGIGMNEQELSRIFNAFSQGDHASGSAHRFGGLGLGLVISQKLIEFHSGRIRAHSDGRDKGAVFTVELPLASAAEINGHGTTPNQHTDVTFVSPAKGGRILLVEDHEPTRTSLARLLARRSYEVVTAASLAEARILARQQDFTLLISDIGLPDGSGYELMAEMGKKGPIRGIALTGYGMEEDLARSRDAGFVAHLTKPIRIQSLETALNAMRALEE
ncbi:MAG TPA: response regulator [Verrucomicrobiae bacterium]|nr:response regulator [Verrucomicrobiae bacterium]